MILQTWVSWPNIQNHTSNGSIICLITDNYKWKRLRSLTIYKTLPRAQDRSWGNKLNGEVHAELLARLKSLYKNVSTNVRGKTNIRTNYICISINKGVVRFNCSKPAMTPWLSYTTTTNVFLEVRKHTRVHIFTISIHHYGSTPVSLRECHT